MHKKTHTMTLILFIQNLFADRELTQKSNYSETMPINWQGGGVTKKFKCQPFLSYLFVRV